MFTIKERSLCAFTADVCKLANEIPTERTREMIRAIATVISETGVGQDPYITQDENFLEYMQALSIGTTRLFKMPHEERLTFIHDIQRRMGLPLLNFHPAVEQRWINTNLDLIDLDLFGGEDFFGHIVHRPIPPSYEASAPVYLSGDINTPTVFKMAARGAATIIGRKIPLVPSAVRGCPPFYGRPVEKNKRREDYVNWRSGFKGEKACFTDKMRVRIWNTAHSVDHLNDFLRSRTTQDVIRIAYGQDPAKLMFEVPLIIAQMLLKYAPVNSISRSKPTVRLKNCLALLLN